MSLSTRNVLLVGVLALLLLIATFYLSYNTGISHNLKTTTTTTELSNNTIIFCNKTIKEKLVKLINEERQKKGVEPVKLVDWGLSKIKLIEMVNKKYFGHCNPEGLILPVEYGNASHYYFEENLGITIGHPLNGSMYWLAKNHIESMIYNDSDSDWGHRNSLLDPTNNLIDLSCGIINNKFYIVIYMIKGWIKWIEPPHYDNGKVIAEGEIQMQGSRLTSVSIYEYESPKVIQWPVKSGIKFTCNSYNIGKAYAVVVPGSSLSGTLRSIEATEYMVRDNWFRIVFPLNNPAVENRTYIILFWVKNKLGVFHPYDPERYNDSIPSGMLVVGRAG